MPYESRTINCSNVDANGCVTPPLANPFNGDVYFNCTSHCTIKVCAAHQVINGSVTNNGCNVIFTGDLTVNSVSGEITVQGAQYPGV